MPVCTSSRSFHPALEAYLRSFGRKEPLDLALPHPSPDKIILACLPAHTTHVLQPLDVGLFQPLGSLYRTTLLRLIKWDSSANVDKVDFIDLY